MDSFLSMFIFVRRNGTNYVTKKEKKEQVI